MRGSRFAVGPMVLPPLVLVATVAVAQPEGFEGTVVVEADEALTVVEADTIHGSLVVMGGKAHVLGRIEGDLIVVDGRATLGPTARIDGDALSVRGAIERHELAQVAGEQKKLSAAEFAQVMAGLSEALEGEAGAQAPARAAEAEPAEPEELEADETAEPEAAEPEQHQVRGDLSSYGQPIVVPADEVRIGDVASFGGAITIDGTVRGDVASFGGPVTVRGEVDGERATFGGAVFMKSGSRVTGDIATLGGAVEKEAGAVHEGRVAGLSGVGALSGRTPAPGDGPGGKGGGEAGMWVASTLLGLVVALLVAGLFPNAACTVADNIATRPGTAFAHGGLTLLLLAPVCLVIVMTVVGLPLVPLLLLAIAVAFVLGLVAIELLVGRRIVASTRWRVASAIGLAVLGVVAFRLAALLGVLLHSVRHPHLTPVLGLVAGCVWLALIAFGIGGALMTGFGTRADGEWITRRFRGKGLALEVTVDDAAKLADELPAEETMDGPDAEGA